MKRPLCGYCTASRCADTADLKRRIYHGVPSAFYKQRRAFTGDSRLKHERFTPLMQPIAAGRWLKSLCRA